MPKAYAILRQQIVAGHFKPGARINIEAQARQLGVSQTPVREAMQRLEADGLVTYSPGKGYSTTPMLDYSGLRQLFEFRMMIEPWASGRAAVNSLSNPAHRLEDELAAFRNEVAGKDDIRLTLLAHDTVFHDTIVAASGNEVARRAYERTHAHLHSYRLFPVDLTGTATLAEHGAIIEAIRGCDALLAEKLMTQHLMNSFDRSAQAFADHSEDDALFGRLRHRRVSMVRPSDAERQKTPRTE